MKYKPEFILIDRRVEHLPTTHAILNKFKDIDQTVIEDVRAIKRPSDFSTAKKTVLITSHRGESFKLCQGTGSSHLCCNYLVLDFISNCPMDCSYCILQQYLQNNPLLTIYANVDEILTRASIFFAEHTDRKFRVGTGELSDSLALDHITGFSKKAIEYFSAFNHVTLELKTKSTNIKHLLNIPEKGQTVLAWSLNPQSIIDSEELNTTTLEERFSAAIDAINAGFRVAFHFDPIIYSDRWENNYKEVVGEIIARFKPEDIAWISLGTLRFPPEMKDIVMKRFPKSRIFYNELIPTNGKVRYFRPIREDIYKKMMSWLTPIADQTKIYLCMETKPVWEKVMPGVGTSTANIERHVCSY